MKFATTSALILLAFSLLQLAYSLPAPRPPRLPSALRPDSLHPLAPYYKQPMEEGTDLNYDNVKNKDY
ncbi:hypothetical protein EI94DRAFT_1802099 [Lactarius quietus]|nr:hypothetical protein EI94DRAFT_1802099 [Lactarius quietus]